MIKMVIKPQFIFAVVRKIWSTQKRYRIIKKSILLTILVFFLLVIWTCLNRKEPIMLLLAPPGIRVQGRERAGGVQVGGGNFSPPKDIIGNQPSFVEPLADNPWEVCGSVGSEKPPPLMAVVVRSTEVTPGDSRRRQRRAAVRRGWASGVVNRSILGHRQGFGNIYPSTSITVVFLIGDSSSINSDEWKILKDEVNMWGDIFMTPVEEEEAPKVGQHVMALKWLLEYCREARYLLVVRDDVYVHLKSVVAMLRNLLPPAGARGLLLCKEVCRGRSGFSGLLVPRKKKPCHCDEKVILYSTDVVENMFKKMTHEDRFPSNEWELTGRVREAINTTITRLEVRWAAGSAQPQEMKDEQEAARYNAPLDASRLLFSHQPGSQEDLEQLWAQLERERSNGS